MITIEEKMDLFTNLVYDKISNESEEKVKQMEERNNALLIEYKKKLIKEAEKITNNINKKAIQKKNEIIAKANINKKNNILKRKQYYINKIVADLYSMAKDYTDSSEYDTFFQRNLTEAIDCIPEKNITIKLTSRDSKRYKTVIEKIYTEKKKTAIIDIAKDSIIGGVIITNSSNDFRIDASLKALFEDKKEYIIKEVYKVLEKDGDNYGE